MEDQVAPSQQPMEGNYYVDPQGPRFANPAEFDQNMTSPPLRPDFAAMRQEAMQRAVQQVTGRPMVEQPPAAEQPFVPPQIQPEPLPVKTIYVRRNLTIAELAVVFAISIVSVVLVQTGWSFATDVLPRIEIRDK